MDFPRIVQGRYLRAMHTKRRAVGEQDTEQREEPSPAPAPNLYTQRMICRLPCYGIVLLASDVFRIGARFFGESVQQRRSGRAADKPICRGSKAFDGRQAKSCPERRCPGEESYKAVGRIKSVSV